MMTDKPRSSYGGAEPLFYDVPLRVTWIVRAVGVITFLMIVIAFIICIVRASAMPNPLYYLLACNTIMSFFIGIVNAWWYKRGHLAGDKYWYMLILAAVIVWQCIATDVYVFHSTPSQHDSSNVTTLTIDTTAASTAKSRVQ